MAIPRTFDIVVAGGGIAGSCFAGVMARAGYGVLLVERESEYRDRVRGEGTWPWGVAEARRSGLLEVYERAESIDILGVTRYEKGDELWEYHWASDSVDGLPEKGFVHTRMQQAAFDWAAEQGAVTLRPAKAEKVRPGSRPSVEVRSDGETLEIEARLVVGADGKQSGIRRFTGGDTCADPERYRMGGVLATGVEWDVYTDDFDASPGRIVNWFPISTEHTRIYVVLPADDLKTSGIAQSFDRLVELSRETTPAGLLDHAAQAGPIAFFPNNDIWTTTISGDGVTLIGDAAGSVDPAQGHGTSLLMRDIRELSETLQDDANWQRAIEGYAERRKGYFDVLHAYDNWTVEIDRTPGPEGDRLRERHARAKDADPQLGGWNSLEARGPDGLVANEAARRHYFGADL